MSQQEIFPVKRKRIRTFSPQQVLEMEFKSIPISEPWRSLIGEPSINFSSIIHGVSSSRKSSFALCLSEELSKFGKVVYISSEELISKTLQARIRLNKIESERIRFVGVRSVDDVELCVKRLHPKFIVIDSVQICGMKFRDFERLKNKVFKNRKSWHLVSQTTNSGKMMLPQSWRHETDTKIKMEPGGIAHHNGRFTTDTTANIFKWREKNLDRFKPAPPIEINMTVEYPEASNQ